MRMPNIRLAPRILLPGVPSLRLPFPWSPSCFSLRTDICRPTIRECAWPAGKHPARWCCWSVENASLSAIDESGRPVSNVHWSINPLIAIYMMKTEMFFWRASKRSRGAHRHGQQADRHGRRFCCFGQQTSARHGAVGPFSRCRILRLFW